MLKPAKQAKRSFLHSIAMAAVLPVEPEQGTYQKEIAIVRAHLETCDPQSWSADPEQACVRHRIFLSVFLKRDLKKTQVKEIFFGACKRLQQSEAKMIANCIHEVKKWLVKKWKNLKTGEKTHPGVLALMHAIFGDAAEGKANDKPVQGIKRRLTSKSPPAKKSTPIKIARDAGVLDISSESGESLQSLGKASSIPSLIAGVHLQNAVVLRKPAGSPMKKPAAGNKKPAASPKACARRTRIAEPVRACARPAVQMAIQFHSTAPYTTTTSAHIIYKGKRYYLSLKGKWFPLDEEDEEGLDKAIQDDWTLGACIAGESAVCAWEDEWEVDEAPPYWHPENRRWVRAFPNMEGYGWEQATEMPECEQGMQDTWWSAGPEQGQSSSSASGSWSSWGPEPGQGWWEPAQGWQRGWAASWWDGGQSWYREQRYASNSTISHPH